MCSVSAISSVSPFVMDRKCHTVYKDSYAGREVWSSGSNLAMESDVDAELDYDEENGDNEEMEPIEEQSKVFFHVFCSFRVH